MRDWASNGAVKIKRAKEHIDNLNTEVRSFFARDTHRVILEEKGKRTRCVVRITEPVPVRWGAVAGDAIHNLRSALDALSHHLGFAGDTRRQGQYFPVYADAEEFKAKRLGKKEGSRDASVDLLKRTMPYQGRDKPLWLLNELDTIDKHEVLPIVCCSFKAIDYELPFRSSAGKPILFKTVRPDLIYPVEDGTVLWVLGATLSPVSVQPKATFDIAFSEPQIVEGQPVIPLLHNLTSLVEGIVATFSDKLT